MDKCKYCERTNQHTHDLFYKDGQLIPDDQIDLKNGKALPGGWSQQELWLMGEQAGWVESGAIYLTAEAEAKGFKHEEVTGVS